MTPLLALLLTHDHLLSKRGIACPRDHPLRLAIERHKARLASELTKARLRRKCPTLETLRLHVLAEKNGAAGSGLQPRWVRINNLKTTCLEELQTLCKAYTGQSTLDQVISDSGATRSYVCDPNVPDLVATNASTKEITSTRSYQTGKIVLQDKASCFPAHLLLNSKSKHCARKYSIGYGDVLDACAAPGNKSTHLASILATNNEAYSGSACPKPIIYACERDAMRSETLHKMLDRAGTGSAVKVLAKQDFLALNPQNDRFGNVTHLLLDPSCSGSGMLSREDVPNLVLPKNTRNKSNDKSMVSIKRPTGRSVKNGLGKRKRELPSEMISENVDAAESTVTSTALDTERLRKLSNLQTRIIEHAFAFSSATVVTYSTCSIHTIENEMVALRALSSDIAKRRSWRVLKRDEQPEGLGIWSHRGDDMHAGHNGGGMENEIWSALTEGEREEFTEACIRCKPGGVDGTMGFFVVGFVRDPATADRVRPGTTAKDYVGGDDPPTDDDEWQGLSADEGQDPTLAA